MNQTPELLPIIIATIGAVCGLIGTVIAILANRKLRKADASEKIASGAEKISGSAMEQLNYFVTANADLRQQKRQLELALIEAKKDYADAMANIARMESEYRLAMENLKADHKAVLKDVETLREEYAKVVEENRLLIERNLALEDELKRVRTGDS
jgi:hypothetical protein